MGAVDARIEADTRDPLRDEPSILACRQTTADCAPAREQKVAGLLACLLEIVVDRLTCLVCQLELDRAACLPLADRRAVDRIAVRRNILDLDGDNVAAAQFAVDRQIEHGEVSGAALDHQSGPDGPDVLWP